MNQSVDITKERKRRQRNRRLKALGALLVLLLIVLFIFYINDVMVKKNVTLHLGEAIDAVGGTGFPAPLPHGAIKNISGVGKNLVILKNSNLYVYNDKGKQTENIQQMRERTAMKTNRDRILLYDTGGSQVYLYSTTSHIATHDMKDTIITADLGDNGEVAIVTWPTNFVAEITVYNNHNEPFYSSLFSEQLVSHIAVSTKGKQLAVSTMGSEEGVLDDSILLYPLDSEEEKPSSTIPVTGELVLWMDYLQEDTLLVLTDKSYSVYDNTGQLVGAYPFDPDFELMEYRTDQGLIALLGRDKDTRDYSLVLVSQMGERMGTLSIPYRPLDFQIGGKNIYLLGSQEVTTYSYALKQGSSYHVGDVERIYLLGDKLYLLTKNEILLLDKSMEV